VGDLIGRARINPARGQPIRDPEPPFDLAQRLGRSANMQRPNA
jgi:hypothetical protein